MKLTKEDILIVRERIEDGEIIEEIPHVKAIRLDKLCEVVKEIKRSSELLGNPTTPTHAVVSIIIIDEKFGKIL